MHNLRIVHYFIIWHETFSSRLISSSYISVLGHICGCALWCVASIDVMHITGVKYTVNTPLWWYFNTTAFKCNGKPPLYFR